MLLHSASLLIASLITTIIMQGAAASDVKAAVVEDAPVQLDDTALHNFTCSAPPAPPHPPTHNRPDDSAPASASVAHAASANAPSEERDAFNSGGFDSDSPSGEDSVARCKQAAVARNRKADEEEASTARVCIRLCWLRD